MTDLEGLMKRGAERLELALKAIDVIEEGLYGKRRMERCAARLTAAMVVLGEMVERTAKETGKHPQAILDQCFGHMGVLFPQKAEKEPEKEPKVEDIPSRPVKPGPSPWAL